MRQYARFLCTLALAGCIDEELDIDELDEEINAPNGVSLNGVSLNGVSLNGVTLTGLTLDSVSLTGVTHSGVTMTGMTVVNSQMSGWKFAIFKIGSGLVGSLFTGKLSNAATLTLRLDGVRALAAPNTDVWSYTFSYQTSAGWTSLCGVNDAIVSPGIWNPTTTKHQSDSNKFTVSCRGSTFSKCIELGYKSDSLLDTYHQACIRALRADYCGDGKANTVNGTEINIFDKLGKQADTLAWTLESNWTPDGAICIGKARLIATTGAGVPACIASRAATACTTSSWGTALIRTESKP
ncbi:MAG: ADYC domain-containing protein [Kofleriaceae bacterium]